MHYPKYHLDASSLLLVWSVGGPGEENANDIQDGNHGTLQNGATFSAGKVGQAFSLDGIDDHIRIPHNINLNPTGPFSVDAWFKANPQQLSPDGLFAIIDKSHGFIDGTGWVIQGLSKPNPGCEKSIGRPCVVGELHFVFGKRGTTGDPANFVGVGTKVSILDDQFHHIVGVFTESELQIYLDGVPRESRAY